MIVLYICAVYRYVLCVNVVHLYCHVTCVFVVMWMLCMWDLHICAVYRSVLCVNAVHVCCHVRGAHESGVTPSGAMTNCLPSQCTHAPRSIVYCSAQPELRGPDLVTDCIFSCRLLHLITSLPFISEAREFFPWGFYFCFVFVFVVNASTKAIHVAFKTGVVCLSRS